MLRYSKRLRCRKKKTAEEANKAAAPDAAGNTTNGAKPAAQAGANPGAQV